MVGRINAILLTFLALLPGLAAADHPGGKAILLPGKGRHHHPIQTANPEAQKFFDQGMTLVFNFNHSEAGRSFRRAAELDPKSPMPHWGIALALGPNYNRDIDPIDDQRYQAAYDAAQQAVALSAQAPPQEQAYVKALAQRYGKDPKADRTPLETVYMKAMRELAREYPDDPDAATLYADSLMVLRPWKLWSLDGKPAETTEEILQVLEGILKRWPDHAGANHLYIHAVEASPFPERGLPSAQRLLELVPWAGHLVHMPAHILIHTGDFELASRANLLAIEADEEYFQRTEPGMVYKWMYYPHNIHFLAFARSLQGRHAEAKKAADKLGAFVEPELKKMPMLEGFAVIPLMMELRFHRWDSVLQSPEPPAERKLTAALRHYGRATAYAVKGMAKEAAVEQQMFENLRKQFPADAPFATNTIESVLAVAAAALEARLATDPQTAVQKWRRAVELEDALAYGEPPEWLFPTRESLGAALLRHGQAAEAEKVFRADLKRHRRSGRSLLGLLESLQAQKKIADAEWVRREFEQAWPKGEPLRLADY
jgi:tetratricopeptide (TPR) repeat protein